MELTEVEDIKKRWQEYTEELYKKDPMTQKSWWYDRSPGARYREWEVKWTLGSITMNKAWRGYGSPAELYQVLKNDDKVLNSICQQIWKTQQWPQDWERSAFIPILRKGNAKECSNYGKISLISHTSKVMLKIICTNLQQYVNWGLSHVQGGFRKGSETRDQMTNICWIIARAREFRKTSASLTMAKPLTAWKTTNCGQFLKICEYQSTLLASWEISMQVKKRQLEPA